MTEEKKSGGWKFPLLLGLMIGALVLTFAFQNSNEVQVKFLFWEGKAILSFTYFVVFAVTILAAVLFGLGNWFRRNRMKNKIKNLEEKLKSFQKEEEEIQIINKEEEEPFDQ